MTSIIFRKNAVAIIGATSIAAIGCGLTKAIANPNKKKGACISSIGFAVLIASANLSKGTAVISAIASVLLVGIGMGLAPAPTCLHGHTWSLAGAGSVGIVTCVIIQILFSH